MTGTQHEMEIRLAYPSVVSATRECKDRYDILTLEVGALRLAVQVKPDEFPEIAPRQVRATPMGTLSGCACCDIQTDTAFVVGERTYCIRHLPTDGRTRDEQSLFIRNILRRDNGSVT